ncbi:putative bifunctional diguanylate cyclase/phosphodiesterase [Saccharospirillum impatiens]|uniref:putative bifunctional diguanylate cyclase/phosphodiesterase n=1 Tax=Saccharospirillum impatiens TaxID=169438 RepID=UPI00056AC75D|nr:EAL domain-containing protein [Saccharospirillum impatiens]
MAISDKDFKALVDCHPRAMMLATQEPRILYVNRAFQAVTGYEASAVVGEKPSVLSSGYHGRDFYKGMWKRLSSENRWEGLVWNQRSNGEIYPQWLTIYGVEVRQAQCYVGTFMDVGDLAAMDEQLASLAYYDVLTRLPNRHLFQAFLESRTGHQDHSPAHFSVLYLDLDFFKEVNDLHGHAQGDELLVRVAQRLQSVLRKGDVLARLSGDEFAAIIEVDSVAGTEAFCDRILNAFKESFVVNDQPHYVSLSIGASLFPFHADEDRSLLEKADQAMYSAKRSGRFRYQIFDPEINRKLLYQESIGQYLSQSIIESHDEFSVVYQPHYMLDSGEVTGLEALVRWHHPLLGLVPPSDFIPIAEKRGWITVLTTIILKVIQNDLAKNTVKLPMGIRLAINVSARHMLDDDFVSQMTRMRRHTDQLNWELELEVTETSLVHFNDQLSSKLTVLQEQGIRIAIDDFGTGYSSLAYLQSLPVNVLKIDRSFVARLNEQSADSTLIRAIIAMAHALSLEVVAEGVESEAQRLILCQLACKHGQGFLFAKPQRWSAQLFRSLDMDQ